MSKKRKKRAATHKEYLKLLTDTKETQPPPERKPSNKQIQPRNIKQCNLLSMLRNENTHIAFAIGPAGTGKTLLATHHAIEQFKTKRVRKIIITRPAVSVDEQHGFLPGTLNEKMAPWTRPIFDIFEEYFSPQQIESMVENNKIEICPLAYMRGRTFKDAIILADEMQNATESQMKMLLTRIGEGSRLIITGDLAQHDRGFEYNGLKMFIERLMQFGSSMINVVQFSPEDVERHPAVAEVLKIYDGTQSYINSRHSYYA